MTENELLLAALRGGAPDGAELASLSVDLSSLLDAHKEPPTELLLLPYGEIETIDKGTFVFDGEAGELLMARHDAYGIRRSADYEHQASSEPVVQAPAAAWYDLELRDDGLWATAIKWTARAAEYLKADEYKYFSPTFWATLDQPRRIVEYFNFALTNNPSMTHLPVLMSRDASTPKGHDMERLKVLAALGLATATTDDDLLAAIADQQAELAQLRNEVKESKAKDSELVSLRARAVKAERELAQLRADHEASQIDAMFAEAVKAGKIYAGEVDTYRAALSIDGRLEPSRLQTLLSGLGAKLPSPPAKRPSEKPASNKSYKDLTNAERVYLEHNDPAEFARLRREAGMVS